MEAKMKEINNGVAFMRNLNEIVILLGRSMELEEMISFGRDVQTEVFRQTRQGVTVGLGRTYKTAMEICVSYREANAALRYRGYMGYETVIPIHYVEPFNDITYRYPLQKEESLVYAAVVGDYDYCEVLLTLLVDALRQSGHIPEYLLSKIVMNIVISINRYASEQNILLNSQFTQYFPTKDIFAITTLEEVYEYLSRCLKIFCGHVRELRDENKHNVVEKAKGYVNEHFARNITMGDVAIQAGTTPEFLTNAFREVEKKTIHEHLTNLRMEEAKRLMRRTDETDEMIAIQVGYDDIRRFRSAFKKYEGVNTQEYRNKEKS